MSEARHLADRYSADALKAKIAAFEAAEAEARSVDDAHRVRNAANRLRVHRAALSLRTAKEAQP